MRWYPAAIGAYLVASLWIQRSGGSGDLLHDLVGSVLAILVTAALGWIAVFRATADPDRRALLTLLAVLWMALFGSFRVAAFALGGEVFVSSWLTLGTWTLLFLLAARGILRSTRSVASVSRALGVASLVLLGFLLPPLVRAWPLARAASAPWRDARSVATPDIYLVVLDKYTSGAWLAENYGVDHAPMEDSLRASGFTVPRRARTNYAHTKLVLTSMLEGALIDTATTGLGRGAYNDLNARIANAPIWSELRSRGYRLAFFPSTFSGTQELPSADLVLDHDVPPSVRWGETLVSNSPLAVVAPLVRRAARASERAATPYPLETLEHLDWNLRTLTTLPDSAGPVAAFLHLLVPHEPYLFADDCSPREPWWPLTDLPPTNDDSLRAAYAAQVRCLDTRLLAAVRELQRRSRHPPVILVVGDHGNGRLATNVLRGFTLELDELAPEQLGERLSVFAALRFPNAQRLVRDDFTLVNLFPTLRHALWSAPLALQPDSSFWSPYQRALEFTAVDPARLQPAPRD